MSSPQESRCKRLSTITDQQHERLHELVTRHAPFSSLDSYGRWLSVQYHFQQEIESLYHWPALSQALPELTERCRLSAVKADLCDLGLPLPAVGATAGPARQQPEAWGWLFVAEGSNLGAAILLKRAHALGLSESHGARHLAGAPEGRARHWRAFTAVVDELVLNEEQEMRLEVAAQEAFRRFEVLLEQAYELPEPAL